MRLSIKKAMADSVSRLLQKYLDMTNILQYPEEEFARFDFFGLRTLATVFNALHYTELWTTLKQTSWRHIYAIDSYEQAMCCSLRLEWKEPYSQRK